MTASPAHQTPSKPSNPFLVLYGKLTEYQDSFPPPSGNGLNPYEAREWTGKGRGPWFVRPAVKGNTGITAPYTSQNDTLHPDPGRFELGDQPHHERPAHMGGEPPEGKRPGVQFAGTSGCEEENPDMQGNFRHGIAIDRTRSASQAGSEGTTRRYYAEPEEMAP